MQNLRNGINNLIQETNGSQNGIDYNKMFDESDQDGTARSFKRNFQDHVTNNPNITEYKYGNKTYRKSKEDEGWWNAYENESEKPSYQLMPNHIGQEIADQIRTERLGKISSNDLFNKAKNEIGTTSRYKSAFYMTPDGSLISGSDGTSRDRAEDHRTISRIYPKLNFEYQSDYLDDFIKRGAIRLIPETDAINLGSKPSESQIAQIMRYARMGYITAVELPNGEYYEDVNPAELMQILKSIE